MVWTWWGERVGGRRDGGGWEVVAGGLERWLKVVVAGGERRWWAACGRW